MPSTTLSTRTDAPPDPDVAADAVARIVFAAERLVAADPAQRPAELALLLADAALLTRGTTTWTREAVEAVTDRLWMVGV